MASGPGAAGLALDLPALLPLVPEHLPLAVCLIQPQTLQILFGNRRFKELTGADAAAGLAKGSLHWHEQVHSRDLASLKRAQKQLLNAADGEVTEARCRWRLSSRRWRWLRIRGAVLTRHADGLPEIIVATLEEEASSGRADTAGDRWVVENSDPTRLRKLLELSELERRMVAYDVHDGFVQDVVGAQLAIDNMLDRLAESDPESVPSLLRVRALIRKAIDEARRVVSELRPATLDNGGLVEAVQFLVGEFDAAYQLQVTFTFPANFPHLSPLLTRALTRIVQEALNNVRRHAGTRSAKIKLSRRGNRVRLQISDRGVGFDVDRVPAGRYGLEGMRERTRAFHGSTTIESQPGKGTRITIDVPMEP